LNAKHQEFLAAGQRRARGAPLIRLENVSKRFGKVVAVDNLTLTIFEGEFFALLGPSGCGKSTLMRLLAGFELPDAGRILLADADLTGVPPHRRPLNMMFQSYALFPHMTVAGNIAYGLRQERLGRSEIALRVQRMLQLVQLEGVIDRRPDQLSGGQRQRAALARALAKEPRVLLLDEPLAALDKKLRGETQRELKEIQTRLGTTFLIVTHDQGEAMSMADRIAVMDRGRIVQVAAPKELYEHPKTRFVAEFVGDINMVEGKLIGKEAGDWRVQTGWRGTPMLIRDEGEPLQAGESVAVAVRPETMTMNREPVKAEGPNALAGQVQDVGYLGDLTLYRLRLDGGAILRVSRPNLTRTMEAPIGQGERVTVSFPAAAGILLRS
jgi:putrescine transport system ATP-binding protein